MENGKAFCLIKSKLILTFIRRAEFSREGLTILKGVGVVKVLWCNFHGVNDRLELSNGGKSIHERVQPLNFSEFVALFPNKATKIQSIRFNLSHSSGSNVVQSLNKQQNQIG